MSKQDFEVDRTIALYERPAMGIVDVPTFDAVKGAIEGSFAPAGAERFLRSVEGASLRIRDFEGVLKAGKLGAGTAVEYAKLGNGDQGQIREFYLASLEQVELGLRDRFFQVVRVLLARARYVLDQRQHKRMGRGRAYRDSSGFYGRREG